ncbi:MAG: RNA-binding S4 domain-containing protein [Atopostipes suicloacalis]|nr:RNA-binding S4 domain-containing protein [Atopostipes suicloacalis]
MRLDKYLKVSRMIKRRTVAKEIADQNRVKINGKIAKSSTKVAIGDEVAIQFGNKEMTVRVEDLRDTTKKKEAEGMYTILSEEYIEE